MASLGPNSPGTLANDATVGAVAWTDAANAGAQDDAYASAELPGNSQTQYLKATNFGFEVPAGATIDGITVEIDRYETHSAAVSDTNVRIVKGGAISLTNRSAGAAWATSDADAYASFGGAADLWGETWTPDDINAADFGVVFNAVAAMGAFPFGANVFVDHIRITVHYTAAAAPGGASHRMQSRSRHRH